MKNNRSKLSSKCNAVKGERPLRSNKRLEDFFELRNRAIHADTIMIADRKRMRVQYAYIEEAKIDQTRLHQPKALVT